MRLSFMLGLMNVGVSGFIIGAYPTMYYLWYVPPRRRTALSLLWAAC